MHEVVRRRPEEEDGDALDLRLYLDEGTVSIDDDEEMKGRPPSPDCDIGRLFIMIYHAFFLAVVGTVIDDTVLRVAVFINR
jgi:hypothetical protein